MAPKQGPRVLPLRLDEENNVVWQGAERLRLTPKARAVLQYLLGRHGQVVDKGLLLDTFWPNPEEASEAALTTCIREIRKALQDKATAPGYIETVYPVRHPYPGAPKKDGGYRFIGPLASPAAIEPDDVPDGLQARPAASSCPPLNPPPELFGRDREFAQLSACLMQVWANGK